LLKDMILERDKKISQLHVNVEENSKKLLARRKELEEVRDHSSESKLQYRRTIASLVKKRDEGLHKIQKIEKEVRNQNGSLHVYADILKEAAPESVDSSYVVRMQSQLCKAMHSMGILEHQLAIVNAISSDVIKSQKEAITTLVNEKSTMELEVMNELVAIDDAKRQVEDEWKANLEKEQLKVLKLRGELGVDDATLDKDSDDDDDEGSSEEEDEYETEMREGLAEMKEAITEMENETAKQLETIESLKAQLEKLKMSGNASPDDNGQQQDDESVEDEKASAGEQENGSGPTSLIEQDKEEDSPEAENGDSPTDNESGDDADAEVKGDDDEDQQP